MRATFFILMVLLPYSTKKVHQNANMKQIEAFSDHFSIGYFNSTLADQICHDKVVDERLTIDSYFIYKGKKIPIGFIKYVSRATGYKAEWILSLWAFETNWGRSKLWRKYNNPAAINYHRGADGRVYNAYDDTYKAVYADMQSAALGLIRVLSLSRYRPLKRARTSEEFFYLLYKCGFFEHRESISTRARIAMKYKTLIN